MLSALQRKLTRDLVRLRGQVVTIALVLAAGISCFITLRGAFASLQAARDHFYARQSFADAFVRLERAPESVRSEVEALPGVARAESRVVRPITLPMPDLAEPIRGVILSTSPF